MKKRRPKRPKWNKQFKNVDQERQNKVYKRWREEIVKRDGGKCRMPGCKKKMKQVHHIHRWVDAPLLRYEPSNGISLCWECHKEVTDNEQLFIRIFERIVNEDSKKDKK